VPWLRFSGGSEMDARQDIGITGFGGTKVYWFENDLGGGIFMIDGGATLQLGGRAALYATALWAGGGSLDTAALSVGLRYSW
jgi:hypothetical protein